VSLTVRSGEVLLAGEQSGEGPAVVLLHGLSATRRYVVMGSRTLERSGHRVIAYDARGHGRRVPTGSTPVNCSHIVLSRIPPLLSYLNLAPGVRFRSS